jgi:ABC-type cobalamin/Fe3+-siderophores transport system ATPase subunit
MSTHQISIAAALADIIWLAKPSNELLTATPEKLLQDNVLQTIFPFVKY